MSDSFETTIKNFSGKSTETKPTIAAGNTVPNGSRWREVDTGKMWFFNLADDTWYDVASTTNVTISDGVKLQDENGTPYGVKHIDNKPRVSSMPYIYDIAEGNVPGHSISNAFGSRDDVQDVTAGSDIWQGAATTIPIPPEAGVQMSVVSTSAQDASGGTGIKTLKVNYIKADGTSGDETITLAGLTPVALTDPNIRFIQGIHAATVGTGGSAGGLITCYSSAIVYSQIRAGYTMSLSTQRMVPLGKTLYITSVYATAAVAGKSIEIRIRTTSMKGVLYPGVFLNQQIFFLENNSVSMDIPPIKLPALTVIKFTCHVPTGKDGAYVSAGFNGWVEST